MMMCDFDTQNENRRDKMLFLCIVVAFLIWVASFSLVNDGVYETVLQEGRRRRLRTEDMNMDVNVDMNVDVNVDMNVEVDWINDFVPTAAPSEMGMGEADAGHESHEGHEGDWMDDEVQRTEEYGSVGQSVIHEEMVTDFMRAEAEKRFYMHFGFEYKKLFDKNGAGAGIQIVSKEAPTVALSGVVPSGSLVEAPTAAPTEYIGDVPSEDRGGVVPTAAPTEDRGGVVPTGAPTEK